LPAALIVLWAGSADLWGTKRRSSNPLDVTMLKYSLPFRRWLPEFMLGSLVLVLAVFYGIFAMAAVHSARQGGADFYISGANPWETVPATQPAADRRVAFRAAPTATP
jgi:hypothetical protein